MTERSILLTTRSGLPFAKNKEKKEDENQRYRYQTERKGIWKIHVREQRVWRTKIAFPAVSAGHHRFTLRFHNFLCAIQER
jgi:hypothetical protein